MSNSPKPKFIRKTGIAFLILLAILVSVDILFLKSHPHFYLDGTPAFYAWYGAATCVVMLLFAKYIVGRILARKDTYYDE